MARTSSKAAGRLGRLHPLPLRIMHWLNAVTVLVLIGSGWKIYNNQPIIGWLEFPAVLTLGGQPPASYQIHGDGGFAGAVQWHFAAMWVLFFNGLGYLAFGLATGRFRRMLVPISPAEVLAQARDALRFRLPHADLTMYNAVQKLLYVGVIAALIVQVLAGLALWKPVQFSLLVALMGGFQGVRLVHFLGMAAIVGFLFVHVALALLVPRTLVAMVTGGPDLDAEPHAPAAAASPGSPLSPASSA